METYDMETNIIKTREQALEVLSAHYNLYDYLMYTFDKDIVTEFNRSNPLVRATQGRTYKDCMNTPYSYNMSLDEFKEAQEQRLVEVMETLSDSQKKLLRKHEAVMALLGILNLREHLLMLPHLSPDGQSIRFFPEGGIDRWNVSHSALGKKWSEMSLVRCLRRRFRVTIDSVPDDVLRDLAETLKVYWDLDKYKVTELKGDEIAKMYRRFESETFNGVGLSSCMTWEGAVDLYACNPDSVSLLFCEGGARGLLWTDSEGKRYLDRVYPDNGPAVVAVKKHAKEVLGATPIFRSGYTERLELVLDMPSNGLVPYMDTLNHGDLIDGNSRIRISNEYSHNTSTELDYTDADPFGSARFCCDYCGDRTTECDAVYIDGDHATWCSYCAEDHAFPCNNCGEMYRDSEAVNVDGSPWCPHCVEREARECKRCGCHTENFEDVQGEIWCSTCTDNDSQECTECGERFSDDQLNDDGRCTECEREYRREANS
jgi:hypothetical protein